MELRLRKLNLNQNSFLKKRSTKVIKKNPIFKVILLDLGSIWLKLAKYLGFDADSKKTNGTF